MGRYTENARETGQYGRSARMTRSADCQSENISVRVIKGNGTINSIGVTPDGSSSNRIYAQTEVDFTLDIYRRGNTYQGNIYIVSYDTRKKINSNDLIYYQQLEDEAATCIFDIQYENGCCTCTYELVVTVSPTDCVKCTTGVFYAYAAPIYNQGVNIGGELTSGEIVFCECQNVICTSEANAMCSTNNVSDASSGCNCNGCNCNN